MEKNEDDSSKKSKIGKKSRAAGQKFEIKVRQDLEGLGWTVSKWINTIDFDKEGKVGKIIPAKRKYNPFSKVLTIGTGFPDFVCFKRNKIISDKIPNQYDDINGEVIFQNSKENNYDYDVIGLEVKSNGYLDQIEKSMCFWFLENKIFSRILIAKKSKEGKGIDYIDFAQKYNKT